MNLDNPVEFIGACLVTVLLICIPGLLFERTRRLTELVMGTCLTVAIGGMFLVVFILMWKEVLNI